MPTWYSMSHLRVWMQKQSCCFPHSHVRARYLLWICRFLKAAQFPIGQTSRNVAVGVILDIQDYVFLCIKHNTHAQKIQKLTTHAQKIYGNTTHNTCTEDIQKDTPTRLRAGCRILNYRWYGRITVYMGGCLIELCVTVLMPWQVISQYVDWYTIVCESVDRSAKPWTDTQLCMEVLIGQEFCGPLYICEWKCT